VWGHWAQLLKLLILLFMVLSGLRLDAVVFMSDILELWGGPPPGGGCCFSSWGRVVYMRDVFILYKMWVQGEMFILVETFLG
jgi:hypothetical protein